MHGNAHVSFLGEGMAVTPFPLTRPFKRGRTFGTLLVNLQTHQVIEVLADRKAETAATWMASHPEIE